MDYEITQRVVVTGVTLRMTPEEAAALFEWIGGESGLSQPNIAFKTWRALDNALKAAREATSD